jgi:hypothetical protein
MQKKDSEKEEKENELEEEFEEENDFFEEDKFVEFITNPLESFSKVLEEIKSPQETLQNLEEELLENPSVEKKFSEENSMGYSSNINNFEEEIKYSNSESKVIQLSFLKNSSGKNSFPNQEIEFKSSLKNAGNSSIEKYVSFKNVEISELGKENFFEKKEVKYKPLR